VLFTQLELPGAYVLDLEPHHDERGFFARAWCVDDFMSRGLNAVFAQSSISFNEREGTLRGMHYQAAPYEEVKLVRCTAGAILDVIVDLRETSTTYTKWAAIELTAANRRQLYIPAGFAHGFQTLCDSAEIVYQISTEYQPGAAKGIRWNDPAFAIRWPNSQAPIMSERDRRYPDFRHRDSRGSNPQMLPHT
jgi:dTDP-4-dehydrorhamnose 3,5-epimerase